MKKKFKIITVLLVLSIVLSICTASPISISAVSTPKEKVSEDSSREAIVYKSNGSFIEVTDFGNNKYVDLDNSKKIFYRINIDNEIFQGASFSLKIKTIETGKTISKTISPKLIEYENVDFYHYYIAIDLSQYIGKIEVAAFLTLANGQKMYEDTIAKLNLYSYSIANGKCGDNLTWILDSKGILNISGTGDMYDNTEDDTALWNNYKELIKSVYINFGVTKIGAKAFNKCVNLKSISISDSVKVINNSAFYCCTSLLDIVIPNSLTIINKYAFFGSGLKSITIPETLNIIGYGAFMDCSNLETVTICGNVDLTEGHTFRYCENLKKIEIKGSISADTYTNGGFFADCKSLEEAIIPSVFKCGDEYIPIHSYSNFNNCIKLKISNIFFSDNAIKVNDVVFSNDLKTLIWYPSTLDSKTYVVPDGTEKIAYCAFCNQKNLNHVVLPDSLKSLGGRAFMDCENLDNVIIPDGVTELYDFQQCTSLKNIVVSSSVNKMYQSYKNSQETFEGITDLTMYCDSNSYAKSFMEEFSFLGAIKDIVYCNFDANGGSISKIKQAVIPNDKYWVLPLPTKPNARFIGWYTEKTGGEKITEDSIVESDKSFTLYAHWNYDQVDTENPTEAPSVKPTEAPTVKPTEIPTVKPTELPTEEPTEAPTVKPTEIPTEKPTDAPKTSEFKWGTDNYNFNNSSPDYFKSSTYRAQINNTYLKKLKSNLTNSEYQCVFEGDGYYNGWLDEFWRGSCYGMSSTTLLSKKGLLPYSNYKSGATKQSDLNAPKDNLELSSLITYYQMLQVKDVIQQQYRTVPNKSNETNIKKIISTLDSNPTVLVGFQKSGWGGHAILATGYEYGSWTWDKVSYQGCIRICDPNASRGYNKEFNIYFNTNSYNWTIPAYSGMKSTSGAKFNYIGANVNEINKGGYLSGSSGNKVDDYVARINARDISDNRSVSKLSGKNGNYSALHASPGEIVEDYSYILGNESEGIIGYNLYDANSSYQVTQDNAQKLQLNIDYADCLMSGGSEAGKKVIFDKTGYIEVSGESAGYNMGMTFDDSYPTDWFTLTVSGEDSDTASLQKVDGGYVLKADNIKNVTVKANNRDNSASTTFSTDYKSVFIYEINEKIIGVKADTNNDGEYDSDLETAIPVQSEPVIEEPTIPVVTEPTESIHPTNPSSEPKNSEPYTFYYLTIKELLEKSSAVTMEVQDINGKRTTYDLKPTSKTYNGVPVYSTELTSGVDVYMATVKYYNGDAVQGQVNFSGSQLQAARGKIINSYGDVCTEENGQSVTVKKSNTIKVTTKTKSLKLKKLKKKAQTVKPIAIKNAKGTVKVTKVKSGTTAKIYKKIKVNSKTGAITFKKGKYSKKTYKIRLKITVSGNSTYKSKTLYKTVKVKVK